jgi:hypothetical protein
MTEQQEIAERRENGDRAEFADRRRGVLARGVARCGG